MIFQDIHKNAAQAWITYKANFRRKTKPKIGKNGNNSTSYKWNRIIKEINFFSLEFDLLPLESPNRFIKQQINRYTGRKVENKENQRSPMIQTSSVHTLGMYFQINKQVTDLGAQPSIIQQTWRFLRQNMWTRLWTTSFWWWSRWIQPSFIKLEYRAIWYQSRLYCFQN